MPITITRKKVEAPAPAPEPKAPLVPMVKAKIGFTIKKKAPEAPAPAPIAPAAARVANERTAFHQLPVAKTVEELMKSGGAMRAPTPTTCTLCGHDYGFPCHGKNPACMNAKHAKETKGKKK